MGRKLLRSSFQELKRFQTHLFTFTKTTMHKPEHMFVTFFGFGKISTPPNVITYKPNDPITTTRSEAGRFVESEIFDGLLNILRNSNEDDGQVCLSSPILATASPYKANPCFRLAFYSS